MSEALTVDAAACRDHEILAEPALSWRCAFCGALRIYDGGRPLGLGCLEECAACGSRIAVKPEQQALATCITQHLV